MADSTGGDQIFFTGVSSCDRWEKNRFKAEMCMCGAHFTDHKVSASTPKDIEEYILYIAAKEPCNEILPRGVRLSEKHCLCSEREKRKRKEKRKKKKKKERSEEHTSEL